MGALTSRQNAGVEEVDIGSTHAYRYPPKTGNYFSSHFIMGGERFETPQPEAYLFGENSDLNFLGSRPTPFPYPAPQANEPTKTLKSLVNIRKESLRFVRAEEHHPAREGEGDVEQGGIAGEQNKEEDRSTRFNIEFTFDCDSRCAITIYYFATEEVSANGVIYTPRDPQMNSETYHYKQGANQQFNQSSHIFDPSQFTEEEMNYSVDKDMIPIVIHCVAEEGDEPKQSHTTIAVVERHLDGTYVVKALKQKLFVDGLCYLLQEIYGIENKNAENTKTVSDEDVEDSGSECVICMCDVRDTLILPCRHLCLCNSCADSLRYQANNCPICRSPFRALLQVRALQKAHAIPLGIPPAEGSQDNIPVGYEAVSLIEALNGPFTHPQNSSLAPSLPIPHAPLSLISITSQQQAQRPASPSYNHTPARAVEALNSTASGSFSAGNSLPPTDEYVQNGNAGVTAGCTTPEICLSVMVSPTEKDVKDHEEDISAAPVVNGTQRQPHERTRRNKSAFIARDSSGVNDTSRKMGSRECDDGLDEEEHVECTLLDASTCTSERPMTPAATDSPAKLSINGKCKQLEEMETTPDSIPGRDSDEDACPDEVVIVTAAGMSAMSRCKPRSSGINRANSATTNSLLIGEGGVSSIPGTPQSVASQRSSGDSFSSTSSTRHLLPHHPSQETLSEDKAVP